MISQPPPPEPQYRFRRVDRVSVLTYSAGTGTLIKVSLINQRCGANMRHVRFASTLSLSPHLMHCDHRGGLARRLGVLLLFGVAFCCMRLARHGGSPECKNSTRFW